MVVELFAFWSLSGFETCRVDILGSKARIHYPFLFLTALYYGNTVLPRFGDPLHRSSVMLHISPSPLYLKIIHIIAVSLPLLSLF